MLGQSSKNYISYPGASYHILKGKYIQSVGIWDRNMSNEGCESVQPGEDRANDGEMDVWCH